MIRRIFKTTVLGMVLAITLLVVPDSGVGPADSYLVSVQSAKGVEKPKDVLWVLLLGSDARLAKHESVLKSRSDAIHLVGLNLATGDGVMFGIPRDSWVHIDGVGNQRVNAALYFGGPQLVAKTVTQMFGIPIDDVFITSFEGFAGLVKSIGGVTVVSKRAFHDDNLPGKYVAGENRVNGMDALRFGRMRHLLPRGDFDRSLNQNELIRGIAKEVEAHQTEPGFMEKGLLSVLKNLHTDLSPAQLFKLAHAVTAVDPNRMTSCVLQGTNAMIGGASVVRPNLALAKKWGAATKDDAKLEGSCDW